MRQDLPNLKKESTVKLVICGHFVGRTPAFYGQVGKYSHLIMVPILHLCWLETYLLRTILNEIVKDRFSTVIVIFFSIAPLHRISCTLQCSFCGRHTVFEISFETSQNEQLLIGLNSRFYYLF